MHVFPHVSGRLFDGRHEGMDRMKWSNIKRFNDQDVNCFIEQTATATYSCRDIFATLERSDPIRDY
jgi:hypothetical protein